MSKKEEVLAIVDSPNMAEGEAELTEEVSIVEVQAKQIVIMTADEFKQAGEFGRLLKRKTAEVTEFFAPMKKAAHDAHKQICDREKAMLAPIAKAEKLLKKTMGDYQMEQLRRQREEEERLRRLAREEEERLLAEAIKMDELGEREMAEEHFENAQFVADAAKTISVKTETAKVEGVSTSYSFEIENIEASKVPVEYLNQLLRPVDEKAVLRLIKEHNGEISIPGITFKKVAKLSFRK